MEKNDPHHFLLVYDPKRIQLAEKINFSTHCLQETFFVTYRTTLTVQTPAFVITDILGVGYRTCKQEAQLSQRKRASNIAISYGAKGISVC